MLMLNEILEIIRNLRFISLLGAILLSAIIWFGGHLVTAGGWLPLASEGARLVVILGIVTLWAVSNIWSRAGAWWRSDALAQVLATPGVAEGSDWKKDYPIALEERKRRRRGA